MARANHRLVERYKSEARKTITDKNFFSSRLLAGHFADIAMAQTRRYSFSRRVKVRLEWKPREPNMAYNSFERIWINTGHRLVTKKKTRLERYEMVSGLFTHELGHVFYTSFPMIQTHTNFFNEEKWYPEKPVLSDATERKNEAELWNYYRDNPEKKEALFMLIKYTHNVLEDGYIENKMLDRYPGVLGQGLRVLRDAMWEDAPTLTQLIELESEDGHIWDTLTSLMLSYVKWGEVKYGEEPMSDERIQVLFSLLPVLNNALVSDEPKERFRSLNKILLKCWPYIKDFLDHCEAVSAASGGSTTIGGVVVKRMSGVGGTSSIATGSTEAVSDGGAPTALSSAGKREETAKNASESETAETESEKDEDDMENEETEPPEDESGTPEEEDLSGPPQGEGGPPTQDVSSDEMGRIPYHQTDRLYEPTGGGTTHDGDYEGSGYTHSAEDIQRLLEDMAEKEAHTRLETERTLALNDLAQSISYGDIHKGCEFIVHRMADVNDDMVDEYRTVAPELLHISKVLQRTLLQKLQDRQKGGKQTGLMMGRKLEARALHRKDGRPFYKNNLPNDRPEMAVALLLDESGSMCSSDRATYARASAIILYDFCTSLRIPIMVYGHSSSGYHGVDLYSYAEFQAIDRDDCFRMMDISARGGNRDGAALRFVAEQLVKRPEEFKLLILVSDGQPADTGYGGTAAEEDLRGIKHEYKRKGITFVAAAIGDDKENIKRIYGDSYMDITDLNKLPVNLTEVVKKNIRV